ncbi:MAG: S49 family peptidase [Gemmataceae bacterium]
MRTESVWAIEHECFGAMLQFIQNGAKGSVPSSFLGFKSKSNEATISGRTAVVQIQGVISHKTSWIEEFFGGVSAEKLAGTIRALGNDSGVKNIVLDIHSPGGEVYGTAELGSAIRDVAQSKKVIAVANAVAASAAYWIASQANEIVVTESGRVGSIGVILMHYDWSKAMEAAGVKATVITSAPFKAEGYSEQPVTEEGMAEMQRVVDHYDAMFVSAVAKGRGTTENKVRKEFGQGRLVEASRAVQLGMADRVATRDRVLGKLTGDAARAESENSLLALDSVLASL